MKHLFSLLAILALAGCGTTSNNITQNLMPLPKQATSWQCDSGNRIIIQPTKDNSTEILYRGETIKIQNDFDPKNMDLVQNNLVWKVNGINANFSYTNPKNQTSYTEYCFQVLPSTPNKS